MPQTNKLPGVTRPGNTARYESLLDERVRTGLVYIDAVCHATAFADAEKLFSACTRLDRKLDRFRRYALDEYRVVMAAEDSRWHVPGIPPVTGPACHLCLKEALGLPVQLVLPADSIPGRAA